MHVRSRGETAHRVSLLGSPGSRVQPVRERASRELSGGAEGHVDGLRRPPSRTKVTLTVLPGA